MQEKTVWRGEKNKDQREMNGGNVIKCVSVCVRGNKYTFSAIHLVLPQIADNCDGEQRVGKGFF